MKQFLIKVEDYDGPIDVLLSMIEERKLSINKISLAQITDDFINFIKENEIKEAEYISNFIYIASVLILIKSKVLINEIELSKEEERDFNELEKQLFLYKTIKKITEEIEGQYESRTLFNRKSPKRLVKFMPDSKTNQESLLNSAIDLNERCKKYIDILPSKNVSKVISIDEMMNRINENLKMTQNLLFSSIKEENSESKKDVIVAFLAILELIKIGNIESKQAAPFEDIELTLNV